MLFFYFTLSKGERGNKDGDISGRRDMKKKPNRLVFLKRKKEKKKRRKISGIESKKERI